MMRIALILLPAAALTIAATPDHGPGLSGVPSAGGVTFAVDGFDSVALGGAETVEVHVGPAFSVYATGPAAAFANFRVARENHTLIIGRRFDDDNHNPDLERRIKVRITLPRIAAATLGGSGSMTIDRVRGDRFKASLGGSGSLMLGEVAIDRADVAIGGSGTVSASGRARALDVSIGGSGRLAGSELHANSARVSVAGSGSVRAAVDGPARVTLVGGGDINLGSGSHCTTTRMGHGIVRCGS